MMTRIWRKKLAAVARNFSLILLAGWLVTACNDNKPDERADKNPAVPMDSNRMPPPMMHPEDTEHWDPVADTVNTPGLPQDVLVYISFIEKQPQPQLADLRSYFLNNYSRLGQTLRAMGQYKSPKNRLFRDKSASILDMQQQSARDQNFQAKGDQLFPLMMHSTELIGDMVNKYYPELNTGLINLRKIMEEIGSTPRDVDNSIPVTSYFRQTAELFKAMERAEKQKK